MPARSMLESLRFTYFVISASRAAFCSGVTEACLSVAWGNLVASPVAPAGACADASVEVCAG